MSTFSSTASSLLSEHPASAFLSYRRVDVEEVTLLQQQLKLRGIRAWRDVTNLRPGGYTQDEVIRAIEQESDVFVLYVTQASLLSDFIWKIEVPAALHRHERDQTYHIIPIFRGVATDELRLFCAKHNLPSLTDFNGVYLPEQTTSENKEQFSVQLRSVAKRILEAALHLRLQRVKADRTYEPYIYLRTFDYEPPVSSLDLDMNWTEMFEDKEKIPDAHVWDKVLLPALLDVKNAISAKTPSRKVHIYVQCILPAAFALGFSFPQAAHFTLMLEGQHGVWTSAGTVSASQPFQILRYSSDGDPDTAVVEIAVSRDTDRATIRSLVSSKLSYKHHIRFALPGGPHHLSGVKDAGQALAMTHQIGQELRRLYDKEGVSHFHLFAALPAALAVLVGHQLNALGTIILYHHVKTDGIYTPLITLVH